MNRNEFMELVYETFADEPDNVLANGIIEAADAYVEHEKEKLAIERLNNMDNYFAKLTANIIKTMLNEWRKGEPNEVRTP